MGFSAADSDSSRSGRDFYGLAWRDDSRIGRRHFNERTSTAASPLDYRQHGLEQAQGPLRSATAALHCPPDRPGLLEEVKTGGQLFLKEIPPFHSLTSQ